MWKLSIGTAIIHKLVLPGEQIIWPLGQVGLLLVFINNFILKFSNTWYFTCWLWPPYLTTTELSCCIISQDLQWPTMPRMFIQCLYNRSFLTLVMICASESCCGNYIINHVKHSLQTVVFSKHLLYITILILHNQIKLINLKKYTLILYIFTFSWNREPQLHGFIFKCRICLVNTYPSPQ